MSLPSPKYSNSSDAAEVLQNEARASVTWSGEGERSKKGMVVLLPRSYGCRCWDSHSSEKQPVESCKSLDERKKSVGKDTNTSLFVNHAAVAWHESRGKQVGDQTQRSPMVKDEIVSVKDARTGSIQRAWV